jgi:cytochrome c oxidase cbb3-type subunit 3
MKRLLLVMVLLSLVGCEREQRQPQIPARYDKNAYAVAQGKTLFRWFNCAGCHANGGGGMGPPLMDEKWLYGSQLQSVFNSIMEGRPNGMPAFRGRVTEDEAWQLAAYVRSMGGFVAKDVAPGRTDGLYPGKPENAR